MIILMMGVSGCGKTTTGAALAAALDWPFRDADDFHPESNVAKMAAGQPLTDADRWPWIERIAEEMAKAVHRSRMQQAGDVRIVYMKGDAATIGARLAARSHRFMPASLLPSQFAALEEPTDATVIDIREPIPVQIGHIRDALQLGVPERS
jgi:gluconate kinase